MRDCHRLDLSRHRHRRQNDPNGERSAVSAVIAGIGENMTRPKIAAHSSGSATSDALTFAHTATSGNNTRLLVALTTTGAPSPNGCTYGGVAMDELAGIYNNFNEVRVYMLDAPT